MPIQQALPDTRDLPTETPAMPEPVKVAVAAAREAGLAYETAANEKGAADAAIKQAEEVDKAADRAAVAAGKSLSSKSAVPEAKDAAEQAARRLDATRAAYRAAFNGLVGAITEYRGEWTAAVSEQRDEAREAMRLSLQGFAEARARHGAATGTLSTLEPFVEGFARPWTSFPRAQRRASGPDSVRDDVVRTLSGRRRFTITEDQIDRVLVELEFLAAGEKPWAASVRGGEAAAQW